MLQSKVLLQGNLLLSSVKGVLSLLIHIERLPAFDLQAVPALQEITHLPVVVDPSHARFWAPWVPALAESIYCSWMMD